MTVFDAMRDRALAEFDLLAAEKEREVRFQMKAAGAPRSEIDAYVEACRPGLAEQRAGIGHELLCNHQADVRIVVHQQDPHRIGLLPSEEGGPDRWRIGIGFKLARRKRCKVARTLL